MTQQKNVINEILDVQAFTDSRQIAINKVGIKSIRRPIVVTDKPGNVQHTVGNFNMYVNLQHNRKGTHMSRLVGILNNQLRDISVESLSIILKDMVKRLETESGHIEINFPYFINKTAPVSGVKSLMDYDITLIGEINDIESNVAIRVIVPVTSLCPCSKQISERGAHNQRSHITVTITAKDHIWINDIIALIEQEASCELFGLLKRADEKYVTERAYDNPKFVEDIVRDVASRLNTDKRIDTYLVETENFESIHNHSAYASIESPRELSRLFS